MKYSPFSGNQRRIRQIGGFFGFKEEKLRARNVILFKTKELQGLQGAIMNFE